MNQSESPWVRGQFRRIMDTFEWKLTDGWVSVCGVFGLHWHETDHRYVVSHLNTGRSVLTFPNHELAAAYVRELSRGADFSNVYMKNDLEYPGTKKGFDTAVFNEVSYMALATLWAERPRKPKVIAR